MVDLVLVSPQRRSVRLAKQSNAALQTFGQVFQIKVIMRNEGKSM